MKVQLRVLVLLCAAFCAPSMWGMSDDEQDHLNWNLVIASRNGERQEVILLLGKRAQVNSVNCVGWTPLYEACDVGCDDVVKILLEYKADTSQANSYGKTSLHIACSVGHEKVVRTLLANQAAVDQEDKDGKTPLRMVCEKYNANQNDARSHIIELLVNGGADTQAVAKQLANTPAGDLVAKLVQASPKGKRKRAKQSGFVDQVGGE